MATSVGGGWADFIGSAGGKSDRLLGESDLLRCFPDAWLTSKSARTIRETVRNAPSLIKSLIRNRAFLVRYKIDRHAKAKPFLALMTSDGPPQKTDLERVLGYTVGFFEVPEA
jgi:hypothetical protein